MKSGATPASIPTAVVCTTVINVVNFFAIFCQQQRNSRFPFSPIMTIVHDSLGSELKQARQALSAHLVQSFQSQPRLDTTARSWFAV